MSEKVRELSERTGRPQNELIEDAVIHHHRLEPPNGEAQATATACAEREHTNETGSR